MDNIPTQVGGLVILVLLAGATGLLAEDVTSAEPDAEALVEDVLNEENDFETIEGTRTKEIETKSIDADEPRVTSLTEDVWIQPPDKRRSEVIATENHGTFSSGDIRVYNGSVRQWYWENRELMIVDDEWESGSHIEEFRASTFEQYDVEYLGTESVADREAYVVEITPADNATVRGALTLHLGSEEFEIKSVEGTNDDGNISYSTTWWIDAETKYPVKEEVKTEHHNPRETPSTREYRLRTTTYEEITYDSDMPDETFVADPPSGTTIADSPENLNVETVDQADEAVPFPVPEPPVPDRFGLVWVNGWEFMDDHSLNLLYREDGEIADNDMIQFRFTDFPPTHTQEDIIREDVGELNATLYEKGHGALIYYCDGIRYEIQADIDGEDEIELVTEVAESMECPQPQD